MLAANNQAAIQRAAKAQLFVPAFNKRISVCVTPRRATSDFFESKLPRNSESPSTNGSNVTM